MKKVCIYGAARETMDKTFLDEGTRLGKLMAKAGYAMVYGAGKTGMMGAVSRGVLSEGGEAIGVTPHFMSDFEPIGDCTEIIYTDTMHSRKMAMEELADIFVITPGGIGTMDEFFEIVTLSQLKQSDKMIIIFNIKEYYTPLLQMMEHMINTGFIDESVKNLYTVASTPEEVISTIDKYI